MIFNDVYRLSNGVEIPKLGLGTWLIDNEKTAEIVKAAIKAGYRHIDTAQAYENEEGAGRGVRLSGIKREDIFLTSKIAAEHKSCAQAAASIDKTLKTMGLDYIDMMLIHSPQPWAEVNQSKNRYFEENAEVWAAMENAFRAGKIRVIGISNFLEDDIINLQKRCSIKPMVNQILAHISNTPLKLIDFCKTNGILTEAYSPIAHGEAMKNPKIKKVAEKYGVSVPKLCIKYVLQLGMVALPKTENTEHMKLNGEVDFEISEKDMEELMSIEKIKNYGESSFFPVFGGKM